MSESSLPLEMFSPRVPDVLGAHVAATAGTVQFVVRRTVG